MKRAIPALVQRHAALVSLLVVAIVVIVASSLSSPVPILAPR
jgi:hypothetical protein